MTGSPEQGRAFPQSPSFVEFQPVYNRTPLILPYGYDCREMNYPAASCGVSKTARYEPSFGEYDPERFNA
jgi:hypothetical protein